MFDIFRNKRVLITGATGFKGSWLVFILKKLGADVYGFGLLPDSNPCLYEIFAHDNDERLQIKNILENGYTDRILELTKPDIVFHLASQPLVSVSYEAPSETFVTNISGLVNLLESARNNKSVKNLVVITSDKCYSTEYGKKIFTESDPMGGLDPYSASKACAEIVSKSYYHSFFKDNGVTLLTARAGNIVGGGDWSKDRLVPDIVRAVTGGKEIMLRNPGAVRPWQHVFDALAGYLTLGESILKGETKGFGSYNFGPDGTGEVKVLDIASKFCEYFGNEAGRIKTGKPEFYETDVLRLDSGKVHKDYGWKSVWNTEESLEETAGWYKAYYDDREKINGYSEKQLEKYLNRLQEVKRNAGSQSH